MSLKIQLHPDNIKKIKSDKVTFVKNFTTIEDKYDFNFLFSLLELVSMPIEFKANDESLFKKVFQIRKIKSVVKDFNFVQDFLQKVVEYFPDNRDDCDIFFSFQSTTGNSHQDIEDVFIIGLEGEVIYKTFGETSDFHKIQKGDMIFIPKGIRHKVIGLSPRITLSIGFYGNK